VLTSAGPTSEAESHIPARRVVVAVRVEVVWVRVHYVDPLPFTIRFLDDDNIMILHFLPFCVLTKLGRRVMQGNGLWGWVKSAFFLYLS